ncbi:hypothetical protein [Streptomyces scabichelini]|uniref:hypothetical protein n=1 Tax=Streptomyces scabichelini TaxID=2711217 RepID=UPI001F4947C2|nr:hypothetical protein [Streptomyces scabichelini]
MSRALLHSRTALRAAVAVTALAVTAGMATTASAAQGDQPGPSKSLKTVSVQGAEGLSVDTAASKDTKAVIENNKTLAAAAANVCGSGYTISTGAWRLPTQTSVYGTLYTWTNGTTTGSRIYDKPICAVFFNDSGYTRYMGVRLSSNYTADPDKEDFGAYSTYAGPVYQKRGYCGTAYAYMENSNGKVMVDALRTVGTCN